MKRDAFAIDIPGELLEEGMFVVRPEWVEDYETRKRYDPRSDAPQLPDVLRVDVWDFEEGESLLSAPDGSVAIDYNTADYPGEFMLVGDHSLDPVFADAHDVGADLKIQDPDACKIVAWDPWWKRRSRSPHEDERAQWVWLTMCRPGFEGQKSWSYDVSLMQGDATELDSVSTSDWAEAKKAILEFRGRARKSAGVDPLDVINRHRRSLGLSPLDPLAAGWTAKDVELEAERIQRLPNLGLWTRAGGRP